VSGILWIERWWGFSLFGHRVGFWRPVDGWLGFGSGKNIEHAKRQALALAHLCHRDVDGERYRWVIHPLEEGLTN